MRVVLYSPWDNAWVPLYRDAFEKLGHEFVFSKNGPVPDAQVYLHGWADHRNPIVPGAKNIVFLRRYELYECDWTGIDWSNVTHFICVNEHVATLVRHHFKQAGITVPVSVIYNAVDTKDWKYKERKANNRVGMACHIHPKKNLTLAMQILAELPEEYELHIAGGNQDQWLLDYMGSFAESVRRKLFIYGQLPFDQMNLWWEQFGVCLSTSYTEGNPNNVIQAMAKGIKPVVHIWPGATEQFPREWLFATAAEAAQMILDKSYCSQVYRQYARDRYGIGNIERVVQLALS